MIRGTHIVVLSILSVALLGDALGVSGAPPGNGVGDLSVSDAAVGRSDDPLVEQRPAWHPEVYGRYVTVPDFVTGGLFAAHTSMDGWAVGAAVRWRWFEGGEWRFGVDWLQMAYAPGNWLESDLPPASSVFLDWDLGFLSLSATHVWRFDLLGDRIVFLVGAGAALGVFIGDVYATDVVPVCTDPVSECVPWRDVTRRTLALPTRVLGLPVITTGFDWRLMGDLTLRIEGGLYGIPYFGGALSYGAW